MPNLIEFLREALSISHISRIVTSPPKDKDVLPNEYYLSQTHGNWELRYLKMGKVFTIPQSQFSQHRGLEDLAAALAKPQSTTESASPFVSSNMEVTKIMSAYHYHDKKAIAEKIKESLENNELGFISRIFSDLNGTYLSKKDCAKFVEEYQSLLNLITKEYKNLLSVLKISDEDFPEVDMGNKKAEKLNRAINLFQAWVERIVVHGHQELFKKNGNVNPEIIYLLINSINPSEKNIHNYVNQFQQKAVKQSVALAYVSLVFQEILRTLPQHFMQQIPDMIKTLTSKLIKTAASRPVTHHIHGHSSDNESEIELSEIKPDLSDLQEVDVNALIGKYQQAVAGLNNTISHLIQEVVSHIKKPEDATLLFNMISRINASKAGSGSSDSLAEIIETLKNENYLNPDNKVYYATLLLASIFTGKDNTFTKEQKIWKPLGVMDDFSRRKCGQEALEFFKDSVSKLKQSTDQVAIPQTHDKKRI
jgi:hypothetical protein